MHGAKPGKVAAVDRAVLAAMSRGDAGVESEFIALYRKLNNEDMERLRKAIDDGDLAGAVHRSHRIVGASRMIGAVGLADVCGRVEAACRAGNLNDVKDSLPELQQEIQQVDDYLDSLLKAQQ